MKTLSLIAALAALPFAAQAAPAKVDPVHTQVLFTVQYFGHVPFTGRFNGVSGEVEAGKTLNLEIDMASVDTHMAKRDNHLQGPDFFNAKQFPKGTFKATEWKKTGDNTWDVTGDFTLRGKTKSVTVKVTHTGTGKDPTGKTRQGYVGELTIDRHEFGVDWGKGGLGAEVTIRVQTSTVEG